jgi:hypothetical protein
LRAVIFLNSKFCVVTVSWRPFPMFSRALRFAAIRVAVMLDRCNR